ncbi:hypothetical protein [Pseudarthrobacter sulfonivorans]|uniref:hypothetical protein n=1 Tax=Pseudarthrobacter sulfonivorans TaxID=121292 RepID=UPI0027887695|nr:hypothetical protein [Pseudarthrobacter sulfonivorans]MDQ0000060.1 hypothetical protein [Pseudarthrobacter sulfonivorans]
MSEVLNAEVRGSEAGGISRRRVVKGVAWSVPVIVTAIAAPAAAASPPPTTGKIEVLWDIDANQGVTFVRLGHQARPDMNRPGTGPKAFYFRNTTAAGSGAILGSITVTPKSAGSALAGIDTFGTVSLTNKKVTSGVFSADFSLTSGVATGSMVRFPVGFYYDGSPQIAAREFTVTVSFTSPTGLEILSPTTTLKLV